MEIPRLLRCHFPGDMRIVRFGQTVRQATKDHLGDVVPIDEAVHRLADGRHGERVEPSVVEFGPVRVEGQLVGRSLRHRVLQAWVLQHCLEEPRVGERKRIEIQIIFMEERVSD
jgi:hypothetical protein